MIKKYTDEEFNLAKSDDFLKLECEHCGNVFLSRKKTIKHELKINGQGCRFCSHKCHHEHIKNERIKVQCKECGCEVMITPSEFKRSESKHFFCSHSCSAKFNNRLRELNDNTKQKISNGLKNFWKNEREKVINKESDRLSLKKCIVCGKEFLRENGKTTSRCCSKECSHELEINRLKYLSDEARIAMSLNARKVIEKQCEEKRSKNEKYFCELCEHHFKDVKHNEAIFNGWDADVIIEDIKYAILWNGVWHYKKITKKHSVRQVQYRDKIKIQEIIKGGYTPYIIKDMGRYNKNFVENEFKNFLMFIGTNV